ncbi:Uncharacterised protein [Bordetella pertussis]|nr:Uncharacterised protein [Bordetella pertussis]
MCARMRPPFISTCAPNVAYMPLAPSSSAFSIATFPDPVATTATLFAPMPP